MSPNPQETANFFTFTEEILNGKFHFLYSEQYHEDLDETFLTVFDHYKVTWRLFSDIKAALEEFK